MSKVDAKQNMIRIHTSLDKTRARPRKQKIVMLVSMKELEYSREEIFL